MNIRLLSALAASVLLMAQAYAQDVAVNDKTCSISNINEIAQKEGFEKAQNVAQVCIKNGYENLKNELKSSEQYQKAKKLLDEKGAQYKEKALNLKKEFLR